jgi:hypothetical protein
MFSKFIGRLFGVSKTTSESEPEEESYDGFMFGFVIRGQDIEVIYDVGGAKALAAEWNPKDIAHNT